MDGQFLKLNSYFPEATLNLCAAITATPETLKASGALQMNFLPQSVCSKNMRKSSKFLNSMLSLLINEFGISEVYKALLEIDSETEENSKLIGKDRTERNTKKNDDQNQRNSVIFELQNNTEIPEGKKAILLELAYRFKGKDFLPSVSDVRNFLESNGISSYAIKNRAEAYKVVFEALISFSEHRLEKFNSGRLHRGPAQLGPLSDAISATGALFRKDRQVNLQDNEKSSLGAREEAATHTAESNANYAASMDENFIGPLQKLPRVLPKAEPND